MLSLDQTQSSFCKICGRSAVLFDVVDFNKFCSRDNPHAFGLAGEPVYYERCISCDFIFTRHCDAWTEKTFSEKIYNADYRKVDGEYLSARPTREAERFSKLFADAMSLRILDYGAGAGIFIDGLRKAGFQDVTGYDPFSSPARPTGKFDLIVAIEVLEHSPNPLETVKEILSFAKDDFTLVFSTLTQPEDICFLRARHWYIAPRNGHVSIHSVGSLCYIAKTFGLLYFEENGLKFLSRGKAPIKNVGKPILNCRLAPPENDVKDPAWNGVENAPSGKGRWTASSQISWRISATQESFGKISLSVAGTASRDFLSHCTVMANGVETALSANPGLRGTTLSATIDISAPQCVIELRTPATVRPTDIGDSPDSRSLGMFVLY